MEQHGSSSELHNPNQEEVRSLVNSPNKSASGGKRYYKTSAAASRYEDTQCSLFDVLGDAHRTSNSLPDLLGKTAHAFALHFPSTVVLSTLTIIPIASIAIGGGNYYRCPAQTWLPVWLIIFGILLLFYLILMIRLVSKVRQEESGEEDVLDERINLSNYNSSRNFYCWLTICQLVWLVFGLYLSLSIYYPKTEMPMEPPFEYCGATLYNFALFVTTAIALLLTASVTSLAVFLTWRGGTMSGGYTDIDGNYLY